MSSTPLTPPNPRPLALLGFAAATVVAGGVIGGTTNAINAAVSPEYFRAVLWWDDVEDIWRASLAMGIFSGLVFGLFCSGVLTLVVGVASRAQCPFGVGMRHLLAVVAAVYACWIIGGLLGLGLAALSPDFFQRTFIRVPEDHGEMLRYAWAGGSIFAAFGGGLLAVVVGAILFPVRWRRHRAD